MIAVPSLMMLILLLILALASQCWVFCMSVCMRVKSRQLCLPLCDPIDYSLPGSSVHEILQARILEWVAKPSSRGSSWPGNWTHISCISWTAGRFFTTESLRKPNPNSMWKFKFEKKRKLMRLHILTNFLLFFFFQI